MAVDWREVFSDRLTKIGYDPDRQELLVQWKKGRVSAYSGVPPEIAERVMTAWSVGQALNEYVIPVYPHHYVT
jgi:hypothetical protein